ncbi:DUF3987 domain-containing protein [Streptomyces niveus]|uniref:DUF3987 domain-containing protein n=1 Tax=Streptomyces niveus TaxID=193462 RepID=UPI0035DC522A
MHRCLAALSPEGDLFDIIAGRYSAKPNLGVFLQAHKGERLQTDRITREQPSVDRPALTIGITSQPAVLHDLASTPGARDRGLLAGFLYALPPSNLGYRKTRTAPVPPLVAETYRARLTRLVGELYALPEPVTVRLTPSADRAVEKLQDQVEAALRPDRPLAHLPDWAGKLVGHTARVAMLLHLADRATGDGWRRPVKEDTVRRAAPRSRRTSPNTRLPSSTWSGQTQPPTRLTSSSAGCAARRRTARGAPRSGAATRSPRPATFARSPRSKRLSPCSKRTVTCAPRPRRGPTVRASQRR